MVVEELKVNVDLVKMKNLFETAWTRQAWTLTYPTVQSGLCVNTQEPNNYLNSCGGGFSFEQEKSFSTLHSFYKDSYINEYLQLFDFTIYRLRWMILFGKGCYSFHRDWTPRIHTPIITNSQSYLIFKESGNIVHLDLGKTYIVDTTQTHSGMNGHDYWRVHLVGCIENHS